MYASDNTAVVAPAVAAWLVAHAPAARGFSADALARAAIVVSLNAHGLPHPPDAVTQLSTLFELSSKFAHSCDANAYYDWSSEHGVLTHKTLRAVAPGEALTVDYHTGGRAESTRVRRYKLSRAKFFDCACAACAAPDALDALPCPACVPRRATEDNSLLQLDRVFAAPADALDWANPTFIALREHPIAIPDDGANTVQEDDDANAGAAAAAASSQLPAWRCASCGGVFSRAAMARITIAAGVRRPLPRSDTLSARHGAARLLDVARWAESGAASCDVHLRTVLRAQPHAVAFAPGGKAEKHARELCTFINELAPIVGTAHASVTTLRLYRLSVAVHGAFQRACTEEAAPCPRGELAGLVRRLLGVRAGSAAAATPASALLTAELASLAATLRRAKRLTALTPSLVTNLTCVVDALGGLEDPNKARCVRCFVVCVLMPARRSPLLHAASCRFPAPLRAPLTRARARARRLLLDVVRDVARGTSDGMLVEEELTTMQVMILSYARFWARGGGGASAA
jgi:hypothetical protein